MLQCPDFKTT